MSKCFLYLLKKIIIFHLKTFFLPPLMLDYLIEETAREAELEEQSHSYQKH